MKKNRLIVIVGIGAFSVVTFMVMKGLLSPDEPKQIVTKEIVKEKKIETAWVLSSKRPMGVGELLSERNIEWLEWPRSRVNKNFIYVSDKNSQQAKKISARLIGRRTRIPLVAGEPVNEDKFLKTNRGSLLSSILESGKRAVSVSITQASGAGGFILPNDRVDVLVKVPEGRLQSSRNVYNSSGFTQDDPAMSSSINSDEELRQLLVEQSRIVLKNIRVLAIDTIISEKNIQTGNIQARTATLEVTPEQSRILISTTALSNNVSLSLRSASDIVEEDNKRDKEVGNVLSDILSDTLASNNKNNSVASTKNNSVRVIRNGKSYNDKFLKQ